MGEMAGAKLLTSNAYTRGNDAALINLESALSKFMDSDVAEESSKMAEYEMLSKSTMQPCCTLKRTSRTRESSNSSNKEPAWSPILLWAGKTCLRTPFLFDAEQS